MLGRQSAPRGRVGGVGGRALLGGADHPLAHAARAPILRLHLLAQHRLVHPRQRARLAAEVDGHVVAWHLAVELLHELLPLLHLALEDGAEVALVADDVGRQEQQQVRLRLAAGGLPEQVTQQGDVAQDGHLGDALDGAVLHDAADDHRLLILGHHRRLRAALRGGRAEHGIAGGDLLGLLGDDHADEVALVDLRLDGELQLHVLAGDGGEGGAQAEQRAAQTGVGAARDAADAADGSTQRARGEAGLEGHVLTHGDFSLLVVAGEQVRGGEHVHVRVLLERVQHHTEGRHVDAQVLQLWNDGPLEAREEAAQVDQRAQAQRGRCALLGVLGAHDARRRAVAGVQLVAGVQVDAELGVAVEVDLHDDGLDEDLAARNVELLDDPDDVLEIRLAGDDDERVGGLVGGHLHLAREQLGGHGRVLAGNARRLLLGGVAGPVGGALGQRLQRAGQLLGVRVLQRVDVDASAGVRGDVHLPDDLLDAVEGARAGHDDELVGALIRDDLRERHRPPRVARALGHVGGRHAPRGGVAAKAAHALAGAPLGLEQLLHRGGDFLGAGVLHLDDAQLVAGGARVQLVDDALQAVHVGAHVVDDDGVRRVRDGVAILGHELLEHAAQGLHLDVLDPEQLRHHLLIGGVGRVRVDDRRNGVLLRRALVDDLQETAVRVDGQPVGVQGRQEGGVERVRVHLHAAILGADDGDLPAHVLREDERLAGGIRHRLHQLLDVDLVEVDAIAGAAPGLLAAGGGTHGGGGALAARGRRLRGDLPLPGVVGVGVLREGAALGPGGRGGQHQAQKERPGRERLHWQEGRALRGLTDVVRLADRRSVALDLDLDAAGFLQLRVDLQGLLGAVQLEAIDAADDVAVLDADLRIDGVRTDGEELEALGLAILEGRHDARLHGHLVEVGQGAINLRAGNFILVLPGGADAGAQAAAGRPRGARLGHGRRRVGGHGRGAISRLPVDELPAAVVDDDDALAKDVRHLGALDAVANHVRLRALGAHVLDRGEGPELVGGHQCAQQLHPQAALDGLRVLIHGRGRGGLLHGHFGFGDLDAGQPRQGLYVQHGLLIGRVGTLRRAGHLLRAEAGRNGGFHEQVRRARHHPGDEQDEHQVHGPEVFAKEEFHHASRRAARH
ncbi:hypothetical protein STIAU_4537 [Stigmatella aurantiaca DW4/3-1]|uniref:Uncharacterized protein n=1 Tax=Stigmatella aurantiaca (strain DW4/3-1) TaxID=378806 RepID=Q08NT5_STIAD|nr:hypothetical protein STIAU_4537 [Stigmatella aurantiaca DW4/3-1]